MVIKALDNVLQCYSFDDGLAIASLLRSFFRRSEQVTLDFAGVNGIPSSFVNGAFVTLLDEFSMNDIKRLLLVTNSSKQINSMIKDRLCTADSERLELA